MLIKTEEIQGIGLELQEPIKHELLNQALANTSEYELISARPLLASFKRVSGQIHLQGSFETTIAAPCHRCLRKTVFDVPVHFAMRMVPVRPHRDEGDMRHEKPVQSFSSPQHTWKKKRHRQHEEGEQCFAATSFDLDELDTEPFDGKTIDLGLIVQEQVLLALPVTVLCNNNCKGLCVICGQDLNGELCGHIVHDSMHRPLAKLKDIALRSPVKLKDW